MTDRMQKIVRRVKAMGLVPKDAIIMIETIRSKSSPVHWEVINVVTDEHYKVGGSGFPGYMWNRKWIPELRDDGWVVLIPGDLIPGEGTGGATEFNLGKNAKRL